MDQKRPLNFSLNLFSLIQALYNLSTLYTLPQNILCPFFDQKAQGTLLDHHEPQMDQEVSGNQYSI